MVGTLSVVAAFLLSEDEEGAIQSRAEEWWIKITDKRNSALSVSGAFIKGIAGLTSIAIDKIFGARPVSFQLLGVSFYLSLASLNLISLVSYQNHGLHLSKPFPFHAIFTSIQLIGVALVPAFASFANDQLDKASVKLRFVLKLVVALWYVRFAWMFVVLVDFTRFAYKRQQGKLVLATLFFFGLALAISGIFDILYIALIKWSVKKVTAASSTRQVYLATLAFGTCLLLVLALFALPITVGLTVMHYAHGGTPTAVGLVGFVIMCSWVFNLINLLACVIGLFIAALLLLHRLLWPSLQRPLYAFQRFGVISNKKLLWGCGTALLLLPQPLTFWHLGQLAFEALRKL